MYEGCYLAKENWINWKICLLAYSMPLRLLDGMHVYVHNLTRSHPPPLNKMGGIGIIPLPWFE